MKKALIILFSLLYIAVGFVSTYHAIAFFAISNAGWLAVILAIAFEIGQAAVLFSLLTSKTKKIMPWILMGVLTLVQVLGNVFSSYQYMMLNSVNQIKYFTDSVLFFLQDPDPKINQVMISYITGAILPIVSLCMTSMVVDAAELELQYSCLENPMDGGAWLAAVHGATKSRTRLSDFTFTFHFHALEEEMATHSSVLAWRIPGMGEPDGLLSMGSHRVGHD